MKSNLIYTLLISLSIVVMSSCKSNKPAVISNSSTTMANAPVVVYKTKADYSMHVPVTMSNDKSELVSYPAPSDVYFAGDLAYPLPLEEGYLLDRRGISENSVFTKWTYYEYSRLSKTPSQDEIMNMLLETNPFSEIYYCGKRSDFNNLVEELNKIIRKGKLSEYQRVK